MAELTSSFLISLGHGDRQPAARRGSRGRGGMEAMETDISSSRGASVHARVRSSLCALIAASLEAGGRQCQKA